MRWILQANLQAQVRPACSSAHEPFFLSNLNCKLLIVLSIFKKKSSKCFRQNVTRAREEKRILSSSSRCRACCARRCVGQTEWLVYGQINCFYGPVSPREWCRQVLMNSLSCQPAVPPVLLPLLLLFRA